MATVASPPPAPAAAVPHEGSPILGANAASGGAAAGGDVLVLSTHAHVGRYVSMLTATLFLLGFHSVLVAIGCLNFDMPCERPLAEYLVVSGIIGFAGTFLYLSLEMQRSREESLLLPTEAVPAAVPPTKKLLVLLALVAALVVATIGAALFIGAPGCAYTSPIVYNWTLASLLLYACFGGLVLLVPLLSVTFPLLAIAILPLIAALVALANWLADAGKRGAYGAASALHRWLVRGSNADAQPPAPSSLPHPASTFALYVNTAAVLWPVTWYGG